MTELPSYLDSLGSPHEALANTWEPVLFDLAREEDEEQLRELSRRKQIHFVDDALEIQLRDLIATRHPERKLSPDELSALTKSHLGATRAWAYGRWCFFPWSGRLVHVLPEAEFRELRTSANRNRITTGEQERLRRLRIGVVGLSVGHATALTLAQEEIGGEYRLADFDTLDHSNLNRLRAGIHEIGNAKTILTARAIFEINPFARVHLFREGVTAENVDDFLVGGGPLDMVFEECDSLHIKILLRERARAHRIAVLMETSDRGMLDIERFDLEPDRPLLHGLIGDVKAEDVRALSNYEKIPLVLRIVAARTASKRLVASMLDIETTLKTWPQLASAVALGGAINADAARRIALGSLTKSGRFYVDFEQIVADSVVTPIAPPLAQRVQVSEEARARALPPLIAARGVFGEAQARTIVHYASLAPSGGNCQPWRFRLRERNLFLDYDRARSGILLDYRDHASYLALGAALENALWAARSLGFEPTVELFPDRAGEDCVARLHFEREIEPSVEAKALALTLGKRVTNRRLGGRTPLPAGAAERLGALAREYGADLDVVDDAAKMDVLADVLADGDRFRFYCARTHREMMREIRWNPEEVERTRDGVDVATLEMTSTDYVGMQLLTSRPLIEEVIRVGGGHGLGKATRKVVASASALGRLTMIGSGPAVHLQGGRALQRVWAEANRCGLAVQPLTALVYLFARLEQGDEDTLSLSERQWLAGLRKRYLDVLPTSKSASEMMLFRIAAAGPPTAISLRRPVDAILTIL